MNGLKRYRASTEIGEILHEQLKAFADKRQVKPADVTREALKLFLAENSENDVLIKRQKKILATEYDKELLRVKAAVSNNINQIARAVNTARLRGELNDNLALKIQRQLSKLLDVMLHGKAVSNVD